MFYEIGYEVKRLVRTRVGKLRLGAFLRCDVPGNRQDMSRLAVGAEYRRHLHVPVSRISLRRVGGALEASDPAAPRLFDRYSGIGISCSGPEIRPRATFQLAEILDLHHPLAAFAHELQAAVEVQNLDAIAASGQNAAQDLVVSRKALARRGRKPIPVQARRWT